MNTRINPDITVTGAGAPENILHSVLAALGNGRISEAVNDFDDHFIFRDRALGLEFADKGQLSEFFRKSRELFPDTVLEIATTFECGDHVIAEWKISATWRPLYGAHQLRIPFSFPGASIVRIESRRIASWSDYYDQNASRRIGLAAFFTEWTEY
jgi:hypothetical protein